MRRLDSVTDSEQGTTEGNAVWTNGERFYIRGVAYQPGKLSRSEQRFQPGSTDSRFSTGGAADAADPLINTQSFRRDAQRFQELGINTIRVYTIDNSRNHDEAKQLLDKAGYSLNRESLASLHAS